nr:DUF72 domain-containing protein [Pelomonas sp. P8]
MARYAGVLRGVEINSSFYRPHGPATYERWAASTPAEFRFSVKCPRAISHDARLDGADEALARFIGEASALGPRWAVMLVQTPPSLAWHADTATRFFERVHDRFGGAVVCEPRHASWFTPDVERRLGALRVARVAADPASWPGADLPAGAPSTAYFRWHGSPQRYRSVYDEEWLATRVQALRALAAAPARPDVWAIFDNTASGAALGNALALEALL